MFFLRRCFSLQDKGMTVKLSMGIVQPNQPSSTKSLLGSVGELRGRAQWKETLTFQPLPLITFLESPQI